MSDHTDIRLKTTRIDARPARIIPYVRSVWQTRAMVRVLAVRDLKIKYNQSFFGILWAVLQPLLGLVVFTFFFVKVVKIDTEKPYPLFVLPGIIAWYFFSGTVFNAGTALMVSQDLIKKIYFPRLLLVLAKIVALLPELLISLALLLLVMLYYGTVPGWRIVFLPVVILLNILTGLSIAVWTNALTVRYRDLYHIIPLFVQYGIWLTPVFFPVTIIPAQYDMLVFANPVAGVIAGYRWIFSNDALPSVTYLIGLVPLSVLLISGLFYFKNVESKINEYV